MVRDSDTKGAPILLEAIHASPAEQAGPTSTQGSDQRPGGGVESGHLDPSIMSRRQSSYCPPLDDDDASSQASSTDGSDLAAARLSSGVLARDRKELGDLATANRLARQDFAAVGLPVM